MPVDDKVPKPKQYRVLVKIQELNRKDSTPRSPKYLPGAIHGSFVPVESNCLEDVRKYFGELQYVGGLIDPKHIQSSGCPHCGGFNTEGSSWSCENNTAWQSIYCVDCDKSWDDVYTLTHRDDN